MLHGMSHQLVTRVGEDLIRHVDALVRDGVLESRSHAVRLGLERLVHQLERERIGESIVEGYRRLPETEDELRRAREAGQRMIEAEPW
jgi:Arc/MetJ-type ribon-helix-helix transcriptional regulator